MSIIEEVLEKAGNTSEAVKMLRHLLPCEEKHGEGIELSERTSQPDKNTEPSFAAAAATHRGDDSDGHSEPSHQPADVENGKSLPLSDVPIRAPIPELISRAENRLMEMLNSWRSNSAEMHT